MPSVARPAILCLCAAIISIAQPTCPGVACPTTMAASPPSVAYGSRTAAADFDGDGIPDLVTLGNVVMGTVLKGKGNGQFSLLSQFSQNGGFPISLLAADFNRDGKQDVAVLWGFASPIGQSSGAIDVFLGKGDGTLAGPFGPPAGFRSGATAFATADLNGDGIPDLVGVDPGVVSVLLGNGDGTFSEAGSYTIPEPGIGLDNVPLAIGDFNGDGKLDIAFAGSSVHLLFGKGDGTFSVGNSIPISASSLAAADFNRDGRLDLAVVSGLSRIEVLMGNGDGTFRPGMTTSVQYPSYIEAAADISGDGVPDLIVEGQFSGTVVLIGNGDGTFQPAWTVAPVQLGFAIADFEVDGSPEIAGPVSGNSDPSAITFLDLALTVVTAGSYAPGKLAPNSLAAAFGRNLATGPAAAVTVQDAQGVTRAATALYSGVDQVNFLVPSGTALGRATITVTSANGNPIRAQTTIAAVAPALFTVGNAGIAAGYAVHVSPDGTQTAQLVFTTDSGSIDPVPIDVTLPGQVYLALFGTGFDAGTANSTAATIQSLTAPVFYAGPQGAWPGLDQVNVLLPASLAGSGRVRFELTVAGRQANTVFLEVR